jgi:hypothetical protein
MLPPKQKDKPAARLRFRITLGAIAVLILVAIPLHNFLAVSRPVGKGILVVEAWVPAHDLAESESVFNSHPYSRLVLVGGPLSEPETSARGAGNWVEVATQRLAKLGYDTTQTVRIAVPPEPVGLRTLSSAEAVGEWLDHSGTPVCCVDVFTAGVHARKSWVFFQQALSDRYKVGIISGGEAYHGEGRSWLLSPFALYTFARDLAGYVYSELWVFSSELKG